MNCEVIPEVHSTGLATDSPQQSDDSLPSSCKVDAQKNPWGKMGANSNPWNSPESKNSTFTDLMSEDLAKNIQQEEEEGFYRQFQDDDPTILHKFVETPADTSNDLLVAQMLQLDFDRQYDQHLKKTEQRINGNSKVSVSYDNFKMCPEWYGDESDDDYNVGEDEDRALDSFEERERKDPVIGARGYIRHGNKLVTKHDPQIAGRKNAEKMMNLPPGINTGDGGGFDINISNKVYNKLQRSTLHDIRRKQRFQDKEEKATSNLALDQSTKLLIFKLINNGVMEEVHGTISTGKESVILYANGGRFEDLVLPEECVIKVFKTTLTDFKTRDKYIKDDYRFKDRLSKSNSRTLIQWWCEKEYHNLRRLQRAGIPSPRPVMIKKHFLIMSFIGRNSEAAPKLKDVKLSFAEWCIAYEQVVEGMIKMFRGCRLVHADLSEYNILWHDDQCWFIDLGQAVEPSHTHALEFLYRDCTNIIRFFKGKKLTNLPRPSQLFETITGINMDGPEDEAIIKIQEYEATQEKWEDGLKNIGDQFDFIWEEIKKAEEAHKQSSIKVLDDKDEEFVPEFITKNGFETRLHEQPERSCIKDKSLEEKKSSSVTFNIEQETSTEKVTPEEQAIYDKIVEAKKKISETKSKKKKNKKKRSNSINN